MLRSGVGEPDVKRPDYRLVRLGPPLRYSQFQGLDLNDPFPMQGFNVFEDMRPLKVLQALLKRSLKRFP